MMIVLKGYPIVFEPMWPSRDSEKNLSKQIPNALKYFTVPKIENFELSKFIRHEIGFIMDGV